ncbi:MAG: hypothetical protein A3D13_01400 [Planctomycetes bacterium RIFCSPHIGHO2_02_FULL_40_12]|nr:MAG: hypothetical protein A3D13_01400 [Planctomycetes bacterium RIFCSPHIGHO2_02_FULL_40_12]OHC02986.1 MAG: hypothetical protein A3H23_06570 [Planctomycetes bacterium RIFCSPLOWO2_12_FULL_40_19]
MRLRILETQHQQNSARTRTKFNSIDLTKHFGGGHCPHYYKPEPASNSIDHGMFLDIPQQIIYFIY